MIDIDCNSDCLFLNYNNCRCCKECAYCGKSLYWSGSRQNIHFDHVRAASKGGRTVVPACTFCNQCKNDKPLKLWLRWLSCNNPKVLERIIEYHIHQRNKISDVVREVRKEYFGR
jgi:hypothetical protein